MIFLRRIIMKRTIAFRMGLFAAAVLTISGSLMACGKDKEEAKNPGIPGTYSRMEDGVEYSIVLEEDHTGMFYGQDDVPLTWDEHTISSGGFDQEYTIEGDELLLDHAGLWVSYTRKGSD